MRSKLMVFASGTPSGGGSGFENLATSPLCEADIVAVVSNHKEGGVFLRSQKLGVPFVYMPEPYSSYAYRALVEKYQAEWCALSGWLKRVQGLPPQKTFNIHPALLSQHGGRFGGKGMWGMHVHEAVAEALARGEIHETGVSMHFVTDEFDRGPVFFECVLPLTQGMNAQDIQHAVQELEHLWQPRVTNSVIRGEIYWDGSDSRSLVGAIHT